MGHVTEPLEHPKTAIRLKPNYWAAWVYGKSSGELGRVEESRRCFEVVLEREPKHPNALQALRRDTSEKATTPKPTPFWSLCDRACASSQCGGGLCNLLAEAWPS